PDDTIRPRPMATPYTKPAHAAAMSNAGTPAGPSLRCTRHAVEGSGEGGETVATMSASTLSTPAAAIARRPASAAIIEVVIPDAILRRSRMPVRSRIQASDVSTIASRCALVMISSGRYDAIPRLAAVLVLPGGTPTGADAGA